MTIIKPHDPPIIWICTSCGHYYAAPDFRPDRNPQIMDPQHRRGEQGENILTRSRIACPTNGCEGYRRPYFAIGLSAVPDSVLVKWADPTHVIADTFGQGEPIRHPAIDIRPPEHVYGDEHAE